jgi:acyl-CoA reductase-like NAD-dependent aldehyde dehydrogenase
VTERGLYVDGTWRGGAATLAVHDPATGEQIGSVVAAGPDDVRDAVASAYRAFPAWAALSPEERGVPLRRAHALMLERVPELARALTLEAGKPLAEARGEVEWGAEFLLWYAEEIRRPWGEILAPNSAGQRLYVRRRPRGVIACITPWNFPSSMIPRKLGPALAAGNTVVLKPAEQTPLSAVLLVEIFAEAGFPPGVVNLVCGDPAPIGAVLTSAPEVRQISFTGSVEVGRPLLRQAAEGIKKVTLELGGHTPCVVFADADLERAAAMAPPAVFGNAGQDCCARSRILVERGALDRFMEALEEAVAAMRVGDPLDDETQMGPLISAGQRETVGSFVDDAAPVAIRGEAPDGPGFWFPPTVLCPVSNDDRAAREEIFGPVAAVIPFRDEAEAIALANDTIYGLSGSIWTRDGAKALRVARAIETGVISINSNTSVRVATPFGGFKQSGYGRELGPHATDAYTEVKTVYYATEAG